MHSELPLHKGHFWLPAPLFIATMFRKPLLTLTLLAALVLFADSASIAQKHNAASARESGFGQRENLGPAINTARDELGPNVTPDGKTLYFDRRDTDTNKLRGDSVWYSTLDTNGEWLPAKPEVWPLNRYKMGSWVSSITPDGNKLLLARSDASLLLFGRTPEGWSILSDMQIDDFYNHSRWLSMCLSSDGNTLILSLVRNETRGKSDLYVSFLKPDSTWSAPLNLGGDINTAGTESSPFLAADGRTLYFSSDSLGGLGKSDIFMSRRLDSTWLHWSPPQNLGAPINSEANDNGFSIPASGEYAYFVSRKDGFGGSDIYRCRLPDSLRPTPVVLLYGKVLNALNDSDLSAEVKFEDLRTGKQIGRASTSPLNGIYKIVLPSGTNYGFRAEDSGYISVDENMDLTTINKYTEIRKDLRLVPIIKGATIPLNNIFFETDKSDLSSESDAELNRLIRLLTDHPTMSILIAGHTDNVGSHARNMRLSASRAEAVQSYLASHGIQSDRLSVMGYGETKPVASNSTEEGRQQNRRVVFTILH
jgi:outer membrane protein OmpA-like peptidoglycan-associated protein